MAPVQTFGKRRSKRLKVFELTTVTCANIERRAHILDLSSSGALVHSTEPPAVGLGLTLQLAGKAILGRTAWVRGCQFGVAFLSPLSDDETTALIGRTSQPAG